MSKPGVTQELRTRVKAHLEEEVRRRRLATVAVVLAVLAACLYFVLQRLLR